MSATIETRTTGNAELNAISFGNLYPGGTSATVVVRFYNSGADTPSSLKIGAMTIDFAFAGSTNGAGQEAITEQWMQAKEGAGAWAPIGGDPTNAANVLSATPPAAGAYVDISFRVIVPAGASTFGSLAFVPFGFYPPG